MLCSIPLTADVNNSPWGFRVFVPCALTDLDQLNILPSQVKPGGSPLEVHEDSLRIKAKSGEGLKKVLKENRDYSIRHLE